jgi:succinate-acetate transporter protein
MNHSSPPPAPAEDPLVEHATRIVLRPLANPLPLGFLALATGTLLLSGLQLGWLHPTEGHQVSLVLLAFVAPLQITASILGFLARDAVAGTGMGVLAGTWLSISLVMRDAPPAATSHALGLLLLVAAVAMLVPTAGSALGKLVATAVLATTAVRFAATGAYQLTDSTAWKEVAGVIGLVLCAVAFYAALAMLLEDVRRTTLLPTFRRARGRSSIRGNLRDQLIQLEHEAGVREQL